MCLLLIKVLAARIYIKMHSQLELIAAESAAIRLAALALMIHPAMNCKSGSDLERCQIWHQ
jgi:hypothetical protein